MTARSEVCKRADTRRSGCLPSASDKGNRLRPRWEPEGSGYEPSFDSATPTESKPAASLPPPGPPKFLAVRSFVAPCPAAEKKVERRSKRAAQLGTWHPVHVPEKSFPPIATTTVHLALCLDPPTQTHHPRRRQINRNHAYSQGRPQGDPRGKTTPYSSAPKTDSAIRNSKHRNHIEISAHTSTPTAAKNAIISRTRTNTVTVMLHAAVLGKDSWLTFYNKIGPLP